MSTSRRTFLAGLAATAAATSACSSAVGDRAATPATPTSPSPQARQPPPAAPSASPSSTASTAVPREDLLHGPRSVPAVALTFHGAGDPALCKKVLAEAASAGAHLTVLAVGSWLGQNPSLATAILDGGHDLGNHTWSHLAMRRLDSRQAHREVARAADLLVRLTGSHGTWFRPSGTARSTATIRAAARASGYPRCLSYDVDPLDYTDPGAKAVTRAVLDAARPGSIVSLHLGHAGTVEALPHVLDGLSGRGLRAVTMTGLMEGTA